MAAVRASAATPEAAVTADSNGNGRAQAPITAASLVRPHLRDMAPYTPIEPFEVLSARYGRTPDQIVKLDANENPYGPPPEVAKALGAMPYANIYPDPSSRALRGALARMHGVDERHLLVRD
jgi:histidinol-phosphate aminotransferase